MLRLPSRFTGLLLSCTLVTLCSLTGAHAQCEPQWSAAFSGPHPDAAVRAMVRPAGAGDLSVYVGGDFTHIGECNARHIALWDGHAWWPLGEGLNGPVHALAMFDADGPGPSPPALYVGGAFTEAGGVPAAGLARWDGGWSAVSHDFAGVVRCLVAVQGPGGPQLYIAGDQLSAAGVPLGAVARWNTTSWAALGHPLGDDGRVLALAWHGSSLFAAGERAQPAQDLPHLARLQQDVWLPVPGALTHPVQPRIAALASAGPDLCVGGDFQTVAGISAQGAAVWRAGQWLNLATPAGVSARSISARQDATGWTIRVGGAIVSTDSSNGQGTVQTVQGAAGGQVRMDAPVLAIADIPELNSFYAGGLFQNTPAGPSPHFMSASPLAAVRGNGAVGILDHMFVADLQDGAGPSLLLHGWVNAAGPLTGTGFYRWDGRRWSRRTAPQAAPERTTAAAIFNPAGPAAPDNLVIAYATGQPQIRRWNGAAWLLDRLIQGTVWNMRTIDDGAGPALYLAGDVLSTGSLSSGLLKWDGQEWSALGGRIPGGVGGFVYVPQGAGSLPQGWYVGGKFHSVGLGPDSVAVQNIAHWNGAWSPLAEGVTSPVFNPYVVRDLAVFDDGTGPQLYVTGCFTTAGSQPIAGIARWNGSQWSDVGGGLDFDIANAAAGGQALLVFDDGAGPALYVGGLFSAAGGIPASNIARWDGQGWSPLGTGVPDRVRRLAIYDDDGPGPNPPALYIIRAPQAVAIPVDSIARWGRPVPIVRRDPRDVTVHSAAPARFHASAPGGIDHAGGDLHYQWRRNGSPLADRGAVSGATTAYLTVFPARHPYAGQYDLVVTNDCGQTATAAATLTILCPADWDGDGTVSSADITAFVGDWLTALANGTADADFDHSGTTNSRDLSTFIAEWLAATQNGC